MHSVGTKDIKPVLCFYRGIFYAIKTEKVDRMYYLQRKFVLDAGISDGFRPLQKPPLFFTEAAYESLPFGNSKSAVGISDGLPS